MEIMEITLITLISEEYNSSHNSLRGSVVTHPPFNLDFSFNFSKKKELFPAHICFELDMKINGKISEAMIRRSNPIRRACDLGYFQTQGNFRTRWIKLPG
jgi:hypothetical protein